MKLETVIDLEKEIKYNRREKDSGEVEIKTDSKILRDISILGISGGVTFIGYLVYELCHSYSF